MTLKILSSRHPVGQPDSMTRSYLAAEAVGAFNTGFEWVNPHRPSIEGEQHAADGVDDAVA
jgi:hypothetical protein